MEEDCKSTRQQCLLHQITSYWYECIFQCKNKLKYHLIWGRYFCVLSLFWRIQSDLLKIISWMYLKIKMDYICSKSEVQDYCISHCVALICTFCLREIQMKVLVNHNELQLYLKVGPTSVWPWSFSSDHITFPLQSTDVEHRTVAHHMFYTKRHFLKSVGKK